MADFNQFGNAKPPQPGTLGDCARCEAMLADALDGTLTAADQAAFDLHMAACPGCAAMLADARRGLAWMEMLKAVRPEPPVALVERIFAVTSGAVTSGAATSAAVALGKATQASAASDRHRAADTLLSGPAADGDEPAFQPAAFSGNVLPFRARFAHGLRSFGQAMLQPRLAMTAAMAFFSIALTMNLTGIRLSSLRASDFKPSSIMRACYNTKARVVRYSDNLRVVYELESRVRDLQRTDNDFPPQNAPATANPQQAPSGNQPSPEKQKQDQKPDQNQDQKQTRPKPGSGSSRRETPGGNLPLVHSAHHRGALLATMQPFVFLPSVFEDEGGLA